MAEAGAWVSVEVVTGIGKRVRGRGRASQVSLSCLRYMLGAWGWDLPTSRSVSFP